MSTATLDPMMRQPGPRLGGLAWVTWRQHRLSLAAVVAVLASFSALLTINGLSMHSTYHHLGLDRCGALTSDTCAVPLSIFERDFQAWAQFLPRILVFLPALFGAFVGAPLIARELESGTFRFGWTQGSQRRHWAIAKLALVGAAITLPCLAFSAVFDWWYRPFEPLMGRMSSGQAYEVSGLVFAARTLFGFAVGALLGTVIRRTVPAMAATAATWLAVAWPSVIYLRPLIEKPIAVPENSNLITQGGWTIGSWTQDAAGRHFDAAQLLAQARTTGVTTRDQFSQWLATRHYTAWVSYQPEGRFWHFQLAEAASYLVASALLAVATIWWVQRRAT